jgi:GTP-binding protein
MFVDRVQIHVQAGRGGNGCLSFRREKYVPKGGPDGGDGGHGGSVIFLAEEGVDSLASMAMQRHWKAPNGQNGGPDNCTGKCAIDLVIKVPPGTIIYDAKHGHSIKDLVQAGDHVVGAQGGRAGRGNVSFKTATDRAPRTHTPGDEGEARDLILELKVIADVGLIGKPNAGKSTLLSRLSRARPEIADYPFTTKHPNLGIVQISFDRALVMADIPGLIEGAHSGHGLGHEFLRHVERAGLLVHLVEPAPMDGSDPIENYRVIRDELRQYDPRLADRPEIVVLTKAELPEADEAFESLLATCGKPVIKISSVTGEGLDNLRRAVVAGVDEAKSQTSLNLPRLGEVGVPLTS